MSQTSTRLFTAWAARHKEAIALEDRLAAARASGDAAEGLSEEARRARAEAERMLQEALAAFRGELSARGIS